MLPNCPDALLSWVGGRDNQTGCSEANLEAADTPCRNKRASSAWIGARHSWIRNKHFGKIRTLLSINSLRKALKTTTSSIFRYRGNVLDLLSPSNCKGIHSDTNRLSFDTTRTAKKSVKVIVILRPMVWKEIRNDHELLVKKWERKTTRMTKS